MPDMKTAMENALKSTINAWADDDKPVTQTNHQKEKAMPNPQPTYNVAHVTPSKVRFVPTVGVSEAVFNYVRDNPGKSRTEIIKTLVSQGFKESSVSSLIGQYLRMDYVFKDSDGKYHNAQKEYKPLPSTKTQIRYTQAKQRALKKSAPKTITLVTKKAKPETAGIAALKADTASQIVANTPAPIHQFDIENMPIKQARALYDQLKQLFGG